jgi:hypothetical protein
MSDHERSQVELDQIGNEAAAEVAEDFDEVEDQLYTDDAEDARSLEERDDPALARFDKSQRDLVTSVVDYNLGSLAELVNKEKIDLAPRYQRRYRWDAKRQSKLIESFLMNVPIPPIFLNEDRYGTYAVIDGKQRIFAIREFIRGRLKLRGLEVFEEVNGKTIDSMPSRLRDILETRANIRAIIILPQSQSAVKFEVFKRLNTGGVRLNPQEIRNSSYPGPLNNLILDLSVRPEFHALLSIKDKDRSAIYREMRDAEFALRFFTFRETWDSFSGGMMRHMDEFMLENQRVEGRPLAMLREDFEQTLEAVEAAFGDHAFQRWVPDKASWRQQVLASLFDAEMFAARGKDPEQLRAKRGGIEKKLKELFSNAEFREAIDAATNTPALFKRRISMMSDLLNEAISS